MVWRRCFVYLEVLGDDLLIKVVLGVFCCFRCFGVLGVCVLLVVLGNVER